MIERCPNCSYILVLIQRRRKYKCAKCSRLFLQKEIEDKTFREWNKREKRLDTENIKIEKRPRNRLSEEEIKRRAKEGHKKWREKNKEKLKQHYLENKEQLLSENREWFKNNKKKRSEYTKKFYSDNRERLLEQKRQYRLIHLDRAKRNNRINHWRTKQRDLAVRELEFLEERAYTRHICVSPPTSVLVELLY